MPAFRVKLGANDLNCVDVLLNLTHSLTLVYLVDNIMLVPCHTVSRAETGSLQRHIILLLQLFMHLILTVAEVLYIC